MTHPERTLVDARERTAPERIYLQDGCDSPECDGDTCGLSHYDGEMTWCADRINPNDTEYVRADLMRAALERVEALEAVIIELGDGGGWTSVGAGLLPAWSVARRSARS